MTAHNKPFNLTARLIRTMGDGIAPRGKGDGRLCVVNYHRILESLDPLLESEPDINTFRWQMELLADCFNVIPLHEAVLALTTERMPPRAVCITFDDGYRSVHDFALPILQEFNLPATIFVTSGYIGEGNMWNDRIIEAIQSLPAGQLDLREVGLGVHSLQSVVDRKLAVDNLTKASKYLPPKTRLELTQKLDGFLNEIRATRPKMLFGYPSALSHFARHAEAKKLRMDNLGIRVAFITSERLYDDQRDQSARLSAVRLPTDTADAMPVSSRMHVPRAACISPRKTSSSRSWMPMARRFLPVWRGKSS